MVKINFKRWSINIFAVAILLNACTLYGQTLSPIGFKTISVYDSSRTYKLNASVEDPLHYRPIDIDLWYPSIISSSDTVASFIDLVHLFETRSNFYTDTKNFNGVTDELLEYLCAGYDGNIDILKKTKTDSYVNAKPIGKNFPLVVYLAGFNGMSYENYLLFESLARHGFIVAAVSSIGRFPGDMTMDKQDLFEQVNDAKFVINYLTSNDSSKAVGLIGYSWGGLAASILSMTETQSIKAIVSLDGSEQLNYFNESEDNEKLNSIRTADFFKPEKIKSSYLYLDSDINIDDNLPDSIFNITEHVKGDKYYLKIDNSKHEDFSCLSSLLAKDSPSSKYQVIQRLTVNYLLDKMKNEDVFYGNITAKGVTRNFSIPAKKNSISNVNVIKGLIIDSKTRKPLLYVNVGIPNKDKGTTTSTNGKFELRISAFDFNDSLRISMVGYESEKICLKDVLKKPEHYVTVRLKEKKEALKEIVVSEKKLTTKVLGNKTESKFFGGKFASNDLGSELAIKIKIKETPTYLEKFSFHISYNNTDTAVFRFNIYNVKDGLPHQNILQDNIIISIGDKTGEVEVDLSKYNLVVDSDLFISLEWVAGNKNSGIVFSSGLVNKGTYYRKASHGNWKKYPIGVGFNLTVNY